MLGHVENPEKFWCLLNPSKIETMTAKIQGIASDSNQHHYLDCTFLFLTYVYKFQKLIVGKFNVPF